MGLLQRLLDALGPAFVSRGGPQLPNLVDGLSGPLHDADDRLTTTDRGWVAAFDLDTSPEPSWIGSATGTQVPGGLTLTQQRAYVRDRASWRRGSPPAIKGAIAQLLTGTRRVDLYERDGSPWHVRIRTYSAETPVTTDQVLAAAATQKPVGITLESEIALGATFDHFEAELASFDQFTATYATFDEASIHVPEEGTMP